MILKRLKNKKTATRRGSRFFAPYGLASAVVVATTATAIIIVVGTVVTTAAEKDDDEDYNPRAVIVTKATHLRKPPSFVFITYYAKSRVGVTKRKRLII